MAEERDDDKFGTNESSGGQQQTTGQQSQQNEFGKQQGGEPIASGSEPPRSMGTRGTEFGQFGDHDRSGQQGQSGTGQADLGSQAATTLAGRADQQELGQDQPGSVGGATGETGRPGEGFIAQQGTGSDDFVQERGASARATEGDDFAEQGRGSLEGDQEDIEGARRRSGSSDSDIEGSSGNA